MESLSAAFFSFFCVPLLSRFVLLRLNAMVILEEGNRKILNYDVRKIARFFVFLLKCVISEPRESIVGMIRKTYEPKWRASLAMMFV